MSITDRFRRLSERLRAGWYRRTGDLEALRQDLEGALMRLPLDLDVARDTVRAYLNKYHPEWRDAVSIHWTVFAGLGLRIKARRILEIGTLNGNFARFLATTFPEAEVVTVDLADDDPRFIGSYGRDTEKSRAAFIEARNRQLDLPNIQFITGDSFYLPAKTRGPFDLIWIDGGHLHPVVSWDVCNAWHLCREGGFIGMDDIVPTGNFLSSDLVSSDGYEVAKYLEMNLGAQLHLVLKKITPGFLDPLARKYIGIVQR